MKAKKYWILAVVVAVGLFSPVSLPLEVLDGLYEEQYEEYECYGPRRYKLPITKEMRLKRNKQKVLGGLKNLYVDFSIDYSKVSPRIFLYRDKLRPPDIEARLKQTGIRIISEETYRKEPNLPSLFITFYGGYRDQTAANHYHSMAIIELHEPANLARNPKMTVKAVTWRDRAFMDYGTEAEKKVVEEAHRAVNEAVDKFINDYLAANPKLEQWAIDTGRLERISKPIFGIYLGEKLDDLKKRFTIKPLFKKGTHPLSSLRQWQVDHSDSRISHCSVTEFDNKAFWMHLRLQGRGKKYFEALEKQFEKEFGKPEIPPYFEHQRRYVTSIDGIQVEVLLVGDNGITVEAVHLPLRKTRSDRSLEWRFEQDRKKREKLKSQNQKTSKTNK